MQKENAMLYIKVADYDFSKRLQVVFKRMDIITFEDITKHTKEDFKNMRNMGRISIGELQEVLLKYNLSFIQPEL